MTVYGAGLRLNEACHLKPAHIDSARMLLRVEEGKGRKDRYTLLSPRLLQELRSYWLSVRPGPWLFFGRERQLPLPEGTGQGIFNHAVERAGLPKKGGIHSLRHSFATHLLESGVEITVVQKLLGHSSLSSTVTYLHVRRERVAQVQSPLQLLDLDGARNKALAAQP
jgi:site-specific recombinase XerD